MRIYLNSVLSDSVVKLRYINNAPDGGRATGVTIKMPKEYYARERLARFCRQMQILVLRKRMGLE